MSVSVFPNSDVFIRTIGFIDTGDVLNVDLVCKDLQQVLAICGVWQRLYEKEMIPRVEGDNRNLRADFKKLYPITLSRTKIEKYLGEFVGKIPRIRLDCFKRLTHADPDEPSKKMGETYEVIVVPEALIRSYSNGLGARINDQSVLEIWKIPNPDRDEDWKPPEDLLTETKMHIPVSFANLLEIFRYSLEGKKIKNVLGFVNSDVIRQHKACATKVHIFFVRKSIPERSLNEPYSNQVNDAKEHGLEIVPLIPKYLSDAIKILESGSLPIESSRTSDFVQFAAGNSPIDIGYRGDGLWVGHYFDHTANFIGAVPSLSVEVD